MGPCPAPGTRTSLILPTTAAAAQLAGASPCFQETLCHLVSMLLDAGTSSTFSCLQGLHSPLCVWASVLTSGKNNVTLLSGSSSAFLGGINSLLVPREPHAFQGGLPCPWGWAFL